jgi:hypothetical protein
MRRWYRQVTHQTSKPSPVDMNNIHATFQALYQRHDDLPPALIPLPYIPTPIKKWLRVLCIFGKGFRLRSKIFLDR